MAMTSLIPKEVEAEVRAQLEPLFLTFYSGSGMYKAYYGYLGEFRERYRRANELLRVIMHLKKEQELMPKEHTALDALLYLTQIELLGNCYVDLTIMLLTRAKKIDLHLEPDSEYRYTRHLTSPKDFESPSLTLGVKLDFLKDNGLSFFEKCIDRTLRNKIAHADFEIAADGKFFQLTEKGKKEVDVMEKFQCFRNYVIAIERVRREQVAKVHPAK